MPAAVSDSALYVVRNEVDPDCAYHCDAVADRFSFADVTAGRVFENFAAIVSA